MEDNCFTVVFVSAVQQHESAINICISPPPSEPHSPLPPSYPSGSSQSTELSSLCGTASHQSSILHIIVHMSVLLSQFIPPSPSSIVSSHPFCISICSENRFIGTLFIDSLYMHQYKIIVFLFLIYFTWFSFYG